MEKIVATFRTVTPMFLGGATPQDVRRFVLPSIKGAIRFWWRALAPKAMGFDIGVIRDREASLFGSSVVGKSSVQMRMVSCSPPTLLLPGTVYPKIPSMPGARYLGYGVVEFAGSRNKTPPTKTGELLRPCIVPGFGFVVEFFAKQTIDPSVTNAITAFGLLGGIGSRTRRGYGSVVLESLDRLQSDGKTKSIFRAPLRPEDYIARCQALLRPLAPASGQPDYTALSSLSRMELVCTAPSAMTALNTAGEAMQMYRSWGKDAKVNHLDSEKNFECDHAWFHAGDRTVAPWTDFHPRRIAFGLPQNYSKTVTCLPATQKRRASPLFIHIHQFGEAQFGTIVTIIPAKFLPDQERINAADNLVTQAVDYRVLTDYMDKLKPGGMRRFPALRRIVP